ncbi:hypothetical protein FB107DRAFT_290290 [Schizophyllum commune]
MEADRPAKRQRLDEDNAPPAKRSDIWFDDGNIILQAENLQFRVHRSLLARHSPVFKDIFGIPQPANTSEVLIEGCPVVHLTDKASHVQFMLTKLFNLAAPENPWKAPTVFDLIASLRMGHKYLITHLWNDAVTSLRRAFPTDEAKILATLTVYAKVISRNDDATAIRLTSRRGLLPLVDVVAEVGLQTILPGLYYRIIYTNTLDTIIGSTDISDRARCVLLGGRAKLLNITTECLKPWGSKTNPHNNNSPNSINCGYARHRFYLTNIDGQYPLGSWVHTTPEGLICTNICHVEYGQLLATMKRRAWDQLPAAFGLPAWKDLKDFDIA